ncbi:DMT family transporter [Burkholderia gladioli]|uniref:DMT family transporter n=1 Tax=Burkholderia gladioli TaxID=28095 RepID=UPI00163F1056|nr:DMT family transporter [Burkholderia gladioli]
MMPWLPFCLLVGAGAAVVVQNTLMARITESASTVLIALIVNSSVGLAALLTLLAMRSGKAGFGELAGALRGWGLVPGLLGAFFVFASIHGYQRFGAGTTIAVLVASQLVFGLLLDSAGAHGGALSARTLLGASVLVLGAFLVASRNG